MLKVLNPVMRTMLRSRLGRKMNSLMVLGFTGRKTGHRYDIPVMAHRTRGELFVLTGAPWRHNFDEGRDVEVTLEGEKTPMHAVPLTEPREIAAVYTRRINELGIKDAQRQIGIKINVPRLPTDEEITDAVSRQHLTAIRLDPRP